MTEPSNPKSKENLVAGYVVGDLDPEEAEEFQQLLAENPELVEEVNCLDRVLEQVLYGLNEVKPPKHLHASILKAGSLQGDRVAASKRFSLQWNKILGSIAALLVLYLGLDNYRLRQDLNVAQDINTMLQDSQSQLFSLKSVNTLADNASGSFLVNLKQQKGAIAIKNLPVPPPGRIYRLWAVVDGEKIPCGQLSPSPQGMVVEKFSMPADFYDEGISGLLITLEPSQSNRYPTGPAIVKSTL